jgi:hypothetical protein
MGPMKAFFLLILLSFPIFPETPGEAIKRRRAEYPELTEIIELAQGAPAEFSARALLRVANSPRLRDKTWKREILEQAFQNASAARNPIRKQIMEGPSTAGSRTAMTSQAAALGLDRLTLQTKAITAMLALDPRRARELFLTIPQPRPSRLHCEDALLDDPSSYYATATAIAAQAFPLDERKRDEPILFLNERIQSITSPVEITPAAALISNSKATPAQLKLLISSLAAALQRMEGDDRTFAGSLSSIVRAVPDLVDIARASNSGAEILTEAYRQFLIRNLTGPRCAESAEKWQQDAVASAVSSFNSRMSSEANAPLKEEELKASKVEGKANLDRVFPSADEQRLRDLWKTLMFGQGQSGLKDEEKNTDEWREQFSALLREIEGMKAATGESEALFFFRKGGALSAALSAAPAGAIRDAVIQQYIAFLRSSNFQQESLTEWFGAVQSLADSMNGDAHTKLLSALENSGHNVLFLYARMERLLPTAPSWVQAGQ